MMHRSSQLSNLDIFFSGYRQALTLSILPLPSQRPVDLPHTFPALKLLHRQDHCPNPNA